jgi:hypothetical protein
MPFLQLTCNLIILESETEDMASNGRQSFPTSNVP